MTIEEQVKKLIQDVNPKLGKLAGAKMNLIKVDNEKAEVFIKIEAQNSCWSTGGAVIGLWAERLIKQAVPKVKRVVTI